MILQVCSLQLFFVPILFVMLIQRLLPTNADKTGLKIYKRGDKGSTLLEVITGQRHPNMTLVSDTFRQNITISSKNGIDLVLKVTNSSGDGSNYTYIIDYRYAHNMLEWCDQCRIYDQYHSHHSIIARSFE
jgi:hypothetical protein